MRKKDNMADEDFDTEIDVEDDDLETEPDEYTAPTEDEWKQTKAALEKANGQAKKYRLALKEQAAKSEDTGNSAATEVETKWKSRFVNVAASAALSAAGAKNATKLLRLLDTDELSVDDDGNVEGLDDQVAELKDEYPELFAEAEVKKTTRRVDAANKGGSTRTLTATEKQLQRLNAN